LAAWTVTNLNFRHGRMSD